MDDTHSGGCLCGAVRYTVTGAPVRAVACHCKFCQRRTGSAFIVSIWFDEGNTRIEGAGNGRFQASYTWPRFCMIITRGRGARRASPRDEGANGEPDDAR